ncbi:hypothetical protein AAZX31_U011200 [Glycine max]
MTPSSLVLFLKIHLVPITLVPSGLGTSSQTSFLLNCSNSSCIALIQNSSVSASFTFLGSILETKHEFETISTSLDLVVTPLFGSPIISSLGCIFWILVEDLLSGWLMFDSSVAESEFFCIFSTFSCICYIVSRCSDIFFDILLSCWRQIINNHIDGFHHCSGSGIEYSICSAVCRVSQEYSCITLGIHLSPLLSICQDVTWTSKDVEVLDRWLPPFPDFIQGGWSPSSQCDSVVDVTCCVHGFSPEIIGKFFGMKHDPSSLLQGPVFPLNYPILLWCNGCRELMSDAFRCAEFSEPAVFKFSAMVTPDSLDDTVFLSLKS